MATRPCEICSRADLELLHCQHFLFPGLSSPLHYDVVSCRACGFTFANEIPDQSTLNQFYQNTEHHLHTELPSGLKQIHADFFQFVQQHLKLKRDTRILDIGSGMGHFLHHFQAAGFTWLLGMEPSPPAVQLAREIYGLEIRAATVDTFASDETFDLITLCGVLEHIADLRESMAKIGSLLRDEGYMFIAVPDVIAFGAAQPTEAFLEFALEHINFFSATSLDNLMESTGFTRITIESQHNNFYDNHYLLALYQKKPAVKTNIQQDKDAAASIRAYVDLSQQRLQPLVERIEHLVRTQEPVVVWGAGALTSRLLCDTSLGAANILSIVDRNRNLQGKILNGVSIDAPDSIRALPGATIFIASTTYAAEIKATLAEQYGWKGNIVTLATEPL